MFKPGPFLRSLVPFLRSLLKILIALAAIAASVVTFRFLILPSVQSVIPLGDAPSTILRRGGSFLACIFGYWAYARFYERRAVTEMRLGVVGIFVGTISGALLISITILSLYAMGNYELLSFRGFDAVLGIGSMIFMLAVLEEFFFRGVLFRVLEESSGTIGALLMVAVIFGALHLFNQGSSIVTLVSVALLGALWTSIYILSRNLWVVGFHHAAWNSAIFTTGMPLSGRQDWSSQAPMESSSHGAVILTGGDFGPEDSIINIVVVAVSVVAVLHWAWRKQRFVSRNPAPAPAEPSTADG